MTTNSTTVFAETPETFTAFSKEEGETTLQHTLNLMMLATKDAPTIEPDEAASLHWMAYFAGRLVSMILNDKQATA
jgi:hypothetical protein